MDQFDAHGSPVTRIGVVGTGFLGRGLLALLNQAKDFEATGVLTRRPLDQVSDIDRDLLTHSADELIERCDIVVECSGDVYHAAEVVEKAHQGDRKVVTMDAEFHATVGSYFCETGFLTEGEGDQPGSLAALHEEVVSMGFEPIVYGNMKGFLNHDPSPEDMQYWAGKNGISLPMVTSFTDGSKLQVEQALVANGLGAGILQQGLAGPAGVTLDELANDLGPRAEATGRPIVDYVLNRELPPGVFIVAKHEAADPAVLRYFKMGDGPYYALLRPYHLCHLEMMRTLRRVAAGGGVLLNNSSSPTIQVVAVAKRDLDRDFVLERGMGSFELRGEAAEFAASPSAVPIGLLDGARIVRHIDSDATLDWEDVELKEGLALEAAKIIRQRMAEAQSVATEPAV